MIKTNVELKCNLCGKEEKLRYFDVAMWVCEKDYKRMTKFVKTMKSARTRYTSVDSWKSRYKLEEGK